MKISYSINHEGTLTIFVDGMSVADISDCKKLNRRQIDNLIIEVLKDLGYDV